MYILIGAIGILIMLGVAFLISNDKKNINWRAVGVMVGLQLIATWVLLGTNVGLTVIDAISGVFNKLVDFAMEGIDFVVGDWVPADAEPFFITAMLVIVFMATLLSVLTHMRILPFIIKYVGGFLSKITGLPNVESFNAVNSIFFGQSEAILSIKNFLPKLTRNRMFIVSTSAMASVSAAIVGAYMTMLPSKYVLVALILNMFSALIIASIMSPVEKANEDEEIDVKDVVTTDNIFDAISQGALDGGKVALIISAMLIAYLGLLAMINSIMVSIVGFDLNDVLSYVFAPIAWIMGVPGSEIMQAGNIMGTKIITNEFVAITEFQPMISELSKRTVGIISTFLVSFGAIGSIGMIGGTVQAVNGAKAKEVSSFGLKMLVAAVMASILSGTVVGLFM